MQYVREKKRSEIEHCSISTRFKIGQKIRIEIFHKAFKYVEFRSYSRSTWICKAEVSKVNESLYNYTWIRKVNIGGDIELRKISDNINCWCVLTPPPSTRGQSSGFLFCFWFHCFDHWLWLTRFERYSHVLSTCLFQHESDRMKSIRPETLCEKWRNV